MIIRFPEDVAEQLNRYFEAMGDSEEPPSLEISLDVER
jgi:hypothetical protein